MAKVGLSRKTSFTDFRCQQSPNFGKSPTGATSAHHFVTPTKARLAPMAHKIDVALGASETMRNGARRFTFMASGRGYQTAERPTDGWVWIDSASRLCCTSFSNSRRTLVHVRLSAPILLL